MFTFTLRTRKLDLSIRAGRTLVLAVLLALSPAIKPAIDAAGASGGPLITAAAQCLGDPPARVAPSQGRVPLGSEPVHG